MRSHHFGQGAVEHFAQPAFPGMEAPAPAPTTIRYTPALALGGQGKPVGMRGSLQDRLRAPERQQRLEQNRQRWASMQMRTEDESYDDEDDPEMGRTIGSIYTEDLGMKWDNRVPHELSYAGSAPSAWRKFGRVEEVPLVGISTPQPTVSARRLEQARTDPTTRSSPRWPKGMEEQPRVYRDPEGRHHVVDGNHRVSSSIANGQMLHPAYVLEDTDIPKVRHHTARINAHRINAEQNPNRNPDTEDRLNDLYFGEGNW